MWIVKGFNNQIPEVIKRFFNMKRLYLSNWVLLVLVKNYEEKGSNKEEWSHTLRFEAV